MSDPKSAIASIKAIGEKLHADAKTSTKPSAAAAIKKLGDDYVGMADGVSKGKAPDTSSIMSDATAMATACTS
ncbi:MAG: hypothetical protein AUG49_03490 [Catenulispora sp. 13_1_20CM_3_70_7]|nr:MAG: hypothetical protein AUG49_03490 [Catenulispora sp. 13_1_20CM_3_70_7]